MTQFIISVIAFVMTLGILIAAHEFGHFWVARKLGVRVLRFSIGFGKSIFRWQKSEADTEYVIGCLPFGGYVKMLDEREGDVPAKLRHQAFNVQNVWKRIAIVAAGPVFNFILAILIYTAAYLIGIPGVKPIVDELAPTSLAATAGFQFKDEIIRVGGQTTQSWQQVRMAVLDDALSQSVIEFAVKSEAGDAKVLTVSLGDVQLFKEQKDILEHLGLEAWHPEIDAVIGALDTGAAQEAGLQIGDRVLRIDESEINNWSDLVKIIRNSPLQPLKVLVLRGRDEIMITLTPKSKRVENEVFGFIAAGPSLQKLENLRVMVRYPLLESALQGLAETGRMITLTFKMLGKLVVGDASLKNISGPISIADYAGRSVSVDISYYLKFLAIISISLGVLNLLPIPLLDGGHLLYYGIEIVKGSPVSGKFLIFGQQAGFLLLACLMSIAIYNDLARIFG